MTGSDLHDAPDLMIALAYARSQDRQKLAIILAFDHRLGMVVAATREPVMGQIKLAWWRDQISMPLPWTAPPDPILNGLAKIMMVNDVNREALLRLVDGWDGLLSADQLDEAALSQYAIARGATLFTLAAQVCGEVPTAEIESAGRHYALIDFACRCSDPETASRVMAMAKAEPAKARAIPRRASLRTLRILAMLTDDDAKRGPGHRLAPGSPRRMLRVLIYLLLRR
jgi:15-cis-phytoene synthase